MEWQKTKRRKAFYTYFGGWTGKTGALLAVLLLTAAAAGYRRYIHTYDPLYDSIEEDPCYEEGTYYIYDKGDYLRFTGYLNRVRKEQPEDEAATAIDAVLMADIDLAEKAYGPLKECPWLKTDVVPYPSLKGHPYIRQCILNYAGVFDGNGHTITKSPGSGNGMFVCIEREGVVKDLTLRAEGLCWNMDEYGVGLMCMINYGMIRNCQTEGSMEGTECYTGGFAGINRGTIKDCVNRADVTLTGIGEYGAGGIAGLSKCKVLPGESEESPIVPVIENCVNYGTILAPWEAGGICARNDCADILACGNEGAVTVQYQRGYLYPKHPDWYERAMAAGICADMGWNSIQDCYNTGRISILEEGEEATYGIAGGTLLWVNTVTGCVNLRGTAAGHMRHESVVELEEEALLRWKEDPDSVTCLADNWQFDLEEAKEKLPLAPLGVAESILTREREDVWMCSEFCLRAPLGYTIREVSPYALCIEHEFDNSEDGGQIWILRLQDDLIEVSEYLDEEGMFTKDTAHEIWTGIRGMHWLHPGYSYAADCHVESSYLAAGERMLDTGLSVVHYRDDRLAALAVGTEDGRMTDNVAVLPITRNGSDSGQVRWLLLFTRTEDNLRPSLGFVRAALRGFAFFPAVTTVQAGESLFTIARQCTGDGRRCLELADYNGLPDPDRIEAGQILAVPPEWFLSDFAAE